MSTAVNYNVPGDNNTQVNKTTTFSIRGRAGSPPEAAGTDFPSAADFAAMDAAERRSFRDAVVTELNTYLATVNPPEQRGVQATQFLARRGGDFYAFVYGERAAI